MTVKSLVDIVDSCPPDDGWGCSVTNDITLNGVPYAPFSKGDKLGRVADWNADAKDRDGRGRSQYNRNFRGKTFAAAQLAIVLAANLCCFTFQINKCTGLTMP